MDRNPLRRRRVALLTALILLAVLAISFYTRPRSLEDLGLPPAQCQRIQAWLNNVDNGDTQTLVLTPEDPAWSALLGLLETGTFRRSLRDLFPRGTWTHVPTPEDREHSWRLDLIFDETALPDGTTGSGALLHLNYFYGKLEIALAGDWHLYRAAGHWAEDLWTCLLSAREEVIPN